MKFNKQLLITLFFCFSLGTIFAQDCSILKNSSFTYRFAKQKVLVEFKGNTYIEYHQDKKYYIKSTIDWVSDCEYNLIVEEANLPDFPFKKGSKLHIRVNKVKGKRVYYTSTIAGRSWEGKMVKVKD